MADAPPTPPRTPTALWIGLLVLFAVFAPSLTNDYAVDAKVLANPFDQSGHTRTEFMASLRSPWFYFMQNYWAAADIYDGLYRPVTIYSFAVTNALGFTSAGAHRCIDLLLHLVAVWLLFRLLIDLRVHARAATWTALMFGGMAIHHEAVVSIVGRSEILSLVCGLGMLLLYMRPGARAKVGSGVLLFLAFASKESSLAWIAFVPCYEFARGIVGARRRWWRNYLMVVVPPLVVWFLLRHLALADMAHMPRQIDYLKNPLAHVDAGTRILTALKIQGYGLWKCFVPYPLSYVYGAGAFALVTSIADPGFLGSLVVLGGFLVCGLWFAKRQPLLFLGMAAFLGFSFVASNVAFPAGTNFGERLYYVPSFGLCLLLPILLRRFAALEKPILIGLAVVALGNAVVILQRNADWSSDESIVAADAVSMPQSANAHCTLAGYLYRDPATRDDALAHIDRAIEIYPEYPRALYRRGATHRMRKEFDQAMDCFARAAQSPYILIATRMQVQRSAESILFPNGTRNETPASLQKMLERFPDQAIVWAAFLDSALRQNDLPAAARAKLAPAFDEAHQRFPRDDLIAIQRGLFRGRDGVQDASEAQAILDDFHKGLWRMPRNVQQDTFGYLIEAQVLAARCFVVLGDRATAGHVLDRLMASVELAPRQLEMLKQEKRRLLRG